MPIGRPKYRGEDIIKMYQNKLSTRAWSGFNLFRIGSSNWNINIFSGSLKWGGEVLISEKRLSSPLCGVSW